MSKAGCDAQALANALRDHDDVDRGLAEYNRIRQPVGEIIVKHSRKLGTHMGVNLQTERRPGDARDSAGSPRHDGLDRGSELSGCLSMSRDLPKPDHARNMRLIGYSDQGGRPDGVQIMVANGHAFIGHMFSRGFSVVDVRDPSNPKPVNYIAAPPGTWNIHLQTHDNLLLVVNAKDMFAARRTSPPNRVTLPQSVGWRYEVCGSKIGSGVLEGRGSMKCPRCGLEMICYVSSPGGYQVQQRRLYFSCQCGMIAARSEEQGLDDAPVSDEGAADRQTR